MRYHTRQFRALVMVVLLTLVAIRGAAVAGPLEDAEAASGTNDYATALPLFRLLADQGNATRPTMKEADLFRQYAQEAARSSSNATSQEDKDALMALACTWAQAALMSERVLGSSFIPSPHYPSLRETNPVF